MNKQDSSHKTNGVVGTEEVAYIGYLFLELSLLYRKEILVQTGKPLTKTVAL